MGRIRQEDNPQNDDASRLCQHLLSNAVDLTRLISLRQRVAQLYPQKNIENLAEQSRHHVPHIIVQKYPKRATLETRYEARSSSRKDLAARGGRRGRAGRDHDFRDNRHRWRSISGFDESAERPISWSSAIKKESRLARALKIFKIVCQAELQLQPPPRSFSRSPPPPAALLFRPRDEILRNALRNEERPGGGKGRRRSRAHVSNLKYVGVVWMGLADASRRANMFTPFVRSTPV
ncbi:hypothetical protein KM043_014274 [Ampulex compressa]|nr:hypothetical protein KM043_014274 [Ampulex compressa]